MHACGVRSSDLPCRLASQLGIPGVDEILDATLEHKLATAQWNVRKFLATAMEGIEVRRACCNIWVAGRQCICAAWLSSLYTLAPEAAVVAVPSSMPFEHSIKQAA